jgi:hypothetical protein
VVLEQIRTQLLAEAEHDLAKAEHYQHSRRQGERNSVRIYLERGTVALRAAALIEQFTVTARRLTPADGVQELLPYVSR